ncbi:unnamed protein product [Rotaria sp. Silwood2]|nr:unnamed protein product [Rotaria sp. Silwood2]CAF4167111.1 unnamed protein product [Rotaria sp. Silwood2]
MSGINDNTPVRKISILGTHDTMAYQMELEGLFEKSVITQTLSLETQLLAGIRAFDIRCRHINDRFTIHHGDFYLKVNFDDVLQTMTKFLGSHSKETLLVRVKEESSPSSNTRSFTDTFLYYKSKYSKIWNKTTDDPFFGDVRGKIVILVNFDCSSCGLSYGSSFQIQDKYSLTTSWDLYDKWLSVKQHLIDANANAASGSYMNYLSGSGGVFPYFVASGHSRHETDANRMSTGRTTLGGKNMYPDFPRVNCFIEVCTIAFEGTNILTYEYIRSQKLKYVGIIMADFPGDGLIDTIINLNY